MTERQPATVHMRNCLLYTSLEKDEYILEVLGEHISRNYIAAKRTEWAEYTSQVTDWEIEQYLYKI